MGLLPMFFQARNGQSLPVELHPEQQAGLASRRELGSFFQQDQRSSHDKSCSIVTGRLLQVWSFLCKQGHVKKLLGGKLLQSVSSFPSFESASKLPKVVLGAYQGVQHG